MSAWHYHYAGMQVASNLPLPEWASFTGVPVRQASDVVLRQTEPMAVSPTCMLTAQGATLTFDLPKVGRYMIHSGREIVLTPDVEAEEEALRLFLLGSAWGALGYQRGWFPLHASVVQIGDGAVAFCAPSGHGKSSLAAWLLQQGYRLVSDDLCRLDISSEQPPQVWPSAPRLKLWQDALHALAWQDQPLCRDQLRMDKFHLLDPTRPRQSRTQAQTLPLRALYVLGWGELTIQPLNGLRAVRAVLEAATYRPEFVAALNLTAPYWQQVMTLVGQIPIFHLQRPRVWAAMPAVGAQLLEQLETV